MTHVCVCAQKAERSGAPSCERLVDGPLVLDSSFLMLDSEPIWGQTLDQGIPSHTEILCAAPWTPLHNCLKRCHKSRSESLKIKSAESTHLKAFMKDWTFIEQQLKNWFLSSANLMRFVPTPFLKNESISINICFCITVLTPPGECLLLLYDNDKCQF